MPGISSLHADFDRSAIPRTPAGPSSGGTSILGVWGGGLPSPPTPVAITAPAAGVVVFLASNNRCRGLVGSSTCACVK